MAPDLHGHGIGQALLSAAEAAAPPTVRTVWLLTGAASDGSVRFYRRNGYALVGETTDAAGIRMVLFEKPVNS